MKRSILTAILLLLVAPVVPTHAASYVFTTIDIPTPDGDLGYTTLSDINDKGEIAGGFSVAAIGVGYLIDKNFTVTTIEAPDAESTFVLGINMHGEISGTFYDGSMQHAFLRDKNGNYTVLDFPNALYTGGSKINKHSQIVGSYRDSISIHGFVWNKGVFLTIDAPFPNAINTIARGINKFGQIVGYYFDSSSSHGYLYDHGTFTPIDFPDGHLTGPADINDEGQIVGTYVDGGGVKHGFLLDGETYITIDVPVPDIILTDPSGINNRGQIVGRYLDSDYRNHGFLLTPDEETPPDKETPANEGVCDELRADGITKGLYGLCVAFCEAQDCEATFNPTTNETTFDLACRDSSPKILENYNRRKTESDPYMPCVNIAAGGCPCWTEEELDVIAGGIFRSCGSADDYAWFTGTGSVWTFSEPDLPITCSLWGYFPDPPKFRRRKLTISQQEFIACWGSIVAECAARQEPLSAPTTIPQMKDGSICTVGGGRIVGLAPGAPEELKRRTLDLHHQHAVATECADGGF